MTGPCLVSRIRYDVPLRDGMTYYSGLVRASDLLGHTRTNDDSKENDRHRAWRRIAALYDSRGQSLNFQLRIIDENTIEVSLELA